MTTDQVLVPVPSAIPAGVPPGLEFLIPTNQIIVEDVKEGMFSHITNQYNILDAWGQRIYYATKTTEASCCCPGGWTIEIFDHTGRSVMSGSMTGLGTQLFVTSTQTGMNLGGVSEHSKFMGRSWHILDGSGAPVLLLDSHFNGGPFVTDINYPLYNLTEPRAQLGMLTKKFNGLFEVELPVNLDPAIKAALIYTTFLLDIKYH